MTKSPRKPHPASLAVYLLLANGLTWLCWLPGLVANLRLGYSLPNFNTYAALFESGFVNSQHLWLASLFQLGVYGPLVGGLVAIWMDGGRPGLQALWSASAKWQLSAKWYLTVLGITFLLTGLPVGVLALLGGFTPSTISIGYVLFALVMQLFTSGLGEEPGWRGFLLPRLEARFGGEKYIWVLGLLWAVWHYPIVIFQILPTLQNVSALQLFITLLLGLAGQTLSLIGMAYLYVWLYHQTGSIFLVIVFHALSNLFNTWLPSFLSNPQALGLFPALMPWVIVLLLQRYLGKARFPGSSQPTSEPIPLD